MAITNILSGAKCARNTSGLHYSSIMHQIYLTSHTEITLPQSRLPHRKTLLQIFLDSIRDLGPHFEFDDYMSILSRSSQLEKLVIGGVKEFAQIPRITSALELLKLRTIFLGFKTLSCATLFFKAIQVLNLVTLKLSYNQRIHILTPLFNHS